MRTKKRWMTSVLTASAKMDVKLPWERAERQHEAPASQMTEDTEPQALSA